MGPYSGFAGLTRFLISDSEPPQQARRRRYLLLARCKRREDDHFHIHESGFGLPCTSLLWKLEAVNCSTEYGHSFRSETGRRTNFNGNLRRFCPRKTTAICRGIHSKFAIVPIGFEERGTSSQALRVCSSDGIPPTHNPSTHRCATRVFVWRDG